MGYFSNLSAAYVPYENDHSNIAPEKQLLFRLEELKEQLKNLSAQQTGKRDEGVCFSEEDLRYVLPEHFLSVSDLRKAIDLVVAQLWGKAEEEPETDEITGMQISFLDVFAASNPCAQYSVA